VAHDDRMSESGRRVLFTRLWPWFGNAHGGVQRSLQIAELVKRAVPDAIFNNPQYLRASSVRFRARVLWESARQLRTIVGERLGPRDAIFLGVISGLLADNRLSLQDVIVFDADRMNGKVLLAAAKKRGTQVIAMPQNFEALYPVDWPPRFDLDQILKLMRREVGWLSRVKRVWAIGTLDQELLNLFGVPARLLPYQPPANRRDDLLSVRQQRAKVSQDHILVMGSAANSPTRTGMVELLRFLRAHPLAMPVVVAGFGTENLIPEAGPGVQVVGAQSDASLQTLLAGAHLLWIHQGPMTGALTRITEGLFAGVPILANRWAARSVAPNRGLVVYDRLEETGELLRHSPNIPTVPDISRYEEEFVADIRLLSDHCKKSMGD
jgi:hypothetical protein